MASDFAAELESVARACRAAADTDLHRELTRGFRDAVEPVIPRIRDGLRPKLPDRYAEVLDADLRLSVNVRTTGSDPGVSLTAQTRSGRGRKLSRLDSGLLTHPVYGNREKWETQQVTPGWFTGPATDAEPQVVQQLEAALERVADEIDRKAAERA